MNIKIIPFGFVCHNTLKMLKTDSPIILQNMKMIARQLFLLFKKSTTFWDNPRMIKKPSHMFRTRSLMIFKPGIHVEHSGLLLYKVYIKDYPASTLK